VTHPSRRRSRGFSAVAVAVAAGVVATVLGSREAAGDVKDQCVDSNTHAQSLRRHGQLAEAREQLRLCADPTCPALVRDDCTQRLDELDRAQPTIVFDLKDDGGNDLVAVTVRVDGKVVTDQLSGRALPLDPGEHRFSFEVAGHAPVARSFVLKEGEKDRRERVVVGSLTPTTAPAAAPSPAGDASGTAPGSPDSPPSPGGDTVASGPTRMRWAGIAAGALGVTGIATGAVLGLSASSALSDQKRDCASATECADHARAVSEHATMETDGAWSTVAFVAGGVLLAGGALLFFGGGDHARPASAATSAIAIAPGVEPGRAGLLVRGAF